jgi:hypothetical protein
MRFCYKIYGNCLNENVKGPVKNPQTNPSKVMPFYEYINLQLETLDVAAVARG